MARNRVVLERTIAEAKATLSAHEKTLGLTPKDKKKLQLNPKWRQLSSKLKDVTKRLERVDQIEKQEAALVVARATPKAPKEPKAPKAAPVKGKKKA